jgi:subtilisin family serine protease
MNIRKKILYIVTLMMSFTFSSLVQAKYEYIVSASNKKAISNLGTIIFCDGVINEQFVFSKSDRQYLISENMMSAYSKKVTVSDKKSFIECVNKITGIQAHPNFAVQFNDDPLTSEQWGINNRGESQDIDISDIDTLEVEGVKGIDLGISTLPKEKNRNILVAVLDTGVDYTHPDLKQAIYKNTTECDALLKYEKCLATNDAQSCQKKWARVDTDGNGYPLDCSGWNVLGNGVVREIKGNNDASDSIGHGTHIAGIIAARNNGIGIEGVSQQVKILPVRVMGDMQGGMSDDSTLAPSESSLPAVQSYADLFARGLLYAIRSNVDIINMSLGWSRSVDSQLMRDLVKLAIKKNIIIVAAAGNDSTRSPIFPCIYDDVICVGSYSSNGNVSHFSNYGASVDIMAPGHKILSTWPEKLIPRYFTERRGYEFKNGTSMAAPFVVGAIGRLLNYGLTKSEAVARVLSSATLTNSAKFSQFGRLDLRNALTLNPQPLFKTVKKGVHYAVWDGIASQAKFSVKLKNIWSSIENIDVKLSLLNNLKDSKTEVQLVHVLKKEGVVEISGVLSNLSTLSGSEYTLEINLNNSGFKQKVYADVEIIVPITSKRTHPLQKSFSLPSTFSLGSSDQIRSFTVVGGFDKLTYLVIKPERRLAKLNLLTVDEQSSKSTYSDSFTFRGKIENIVGLWQLDFEGDGELDFVIAERVLKTVRVQGQRSSSNMIYFHFFNSSFKPKKVELLGQNRSTITYDNKIAVIDKNFRWLPLNGKLVPSWVGKGESTKPLESYNPWAPQTEPKKGRFFYYFAVNKLKSFEFDSDYQVLGFLPKTQGKMTRLYFAKGSGFVYEFFTLEFEDLSTLSEHFNSISMENGYYMLGGLELDAVSSSNLTSFTDISSTGLLVGTLNNNRIEQIYHLNNLSVLDPIHAIAGVSYRNDQLYSYAIGKYNLYLYENDRFLSLTSLKRFSFLPGMTFDQFLFPVTDSNGVQGIYFPSSLGVSLSSEIIIANSNGQLYRPASYRILPAESCQELNNVKVANVDHLSYLCQGELRLIPLNFK